MSVVRSGGRPPSGLRRAAAGVVVFVVLLAGSARPAAIAPARYADLLAETHAGEWICVRRPDRDDVADLHWSLSADGLSVVVSADPADDAGESETYRYVTERRGWLVHATNAGRTQTSADAYDIEMHDVTAAPEDNGAPTFEGTLRSFARRRPVRLREVLYFANDRWYQSRFILVGGRWRAVERRPCGRLNPAG